MKSCNNRLYGAEFSPEEIAEAVRCGRLLSMEVEFSRRCNFNCVYCYAKDNSNFEGELSVDEIRDLILQARDLGAKKIIILGGEPMIYPHIFDMLDFIRSQCLQIELFTNGTGIDPWTARRLCEQGIAVVLKMNTFDEKIQDMLSGRKGAYSQIHEAFNNLKDAGYPSGAPLGISSIICSQNIDELEQMWQWLRDQEITPYFEMITPQGNARKSGFLDVDTNRVHNFFYKIAEIDRKKYGNHWEPQPPLVGGECRRHQFSCAVDSYGNVQPCVGVSIPVGNIRQKKLADIVQDSEVIQDLKNYKQTIKGPCGECASLNRCYGCRGAAFQLTGDYLASDPLCWKNLERQDDIGRLPMDTAKLVPHKPPMLLVNKLLRVGEKESVSEFVIEKDTILVAEDGRLDEAYYPEIISQAIAAQSGFKNLRNGGPVSKGFLLGVKNLEILGSAGIGDTLRIFVYKIAKYGEFGVIRGEIFKGEDIIARGEIKVWHENK
jgi:radical SAM protein with 4Fe4S-binding SPASM domain